MLAMGLPSTSTDFTVKHPVANSLLDIIGASCCAAAGVVISDAAPLAKTK
jgi:hypothetical protein